MKPNRVLRVIHLSLFLTTLLTADVGAQGKLSSTLGLPGSTIVFPKGELKLGTRTVWTAGGLEVRVKKYDANPNSGITLGHEVVIQTTTGKTVRAKAIESGSHSNFLTILPDGLSRTKWIPFEAIQSVAVRTAEVKAYEGVEAMEEVYGRFSFSTPQGERQGSDHAFTLVVQVKLLYPHKQGAKSINGRLVDACDSLAIFGANEPTSLSWDKVESLEIHRRANDKSNQKKATTTKLPSFVYRSQGGWSNVWNEYEPKTETDKETNRVKEKPAVAVVPIRLTTVGQEKNKLVTDIAKLLGDKLSKDDGITVRSQEEIIEALRQSKLSYDDLRVKDTKELVKALPGTDILVIVGPHPSPKKGKDAFLTFLVVRSSDLKGSRSSSLLSDGQIEIDDPEFFVNEGSVEKFKATIKELLGGDKK